MCKQAVYPVECLAFQQSAFPEPDTILINTISYTDSTASRTIVQKKEYKHLGLNVLYMLFHAQGFDVCFPVMQKPKASFLQKGKNCCSWSW